MGEFTAAGFEDELAEVVWFGGLKLLFGEAVEPGGTIGEEVLPASDEEIFFVNLAWFRRVLWKGADEAVVGELFAEPGDGEVDGGDAEAVEQGDGEVGELEKHLPKGDGP